MEFPRNIASAPQLVTLYFLTVLSRTLASLLLLK
uniref:Uncharacterized protein n=1 Tax=Arundo donax TaxID=35708 RepID=A0A0A9G560_ARUDO